jgi:hypothetical protein
MHACSQQTQTLNPELKPDAFSFQKTRQVFKPCCQNERMQAVTPLLQVRQLVDTMLLSTATIYFFFFSKKGKRKEEKLNWIAAYVPTTKFGKSGDCYQTLAFAQQQQLLLLMLPVHLHLLPTFNYYSPARRQRLPKAAAGLGWASLLLTSHSHLGGGATCPSPNANAPAPFSLSGPSRTWKTKTRSRSHHGPPGACQFRPGG